MCAPYCEVMLHAIAEDNDRQSRHELYKKNNDNPRGVNRVNEPQELAKQGKMNIAHLNTKLVLGMMRNVVKGPWTA